MTVSNQKIKVGIVGGTGYTGVELLRILSQHPQVDLHAITSRSEEGVAVADMFPSLRGKVDLRFVTPDNASLNDCDVVFFENFGERIHQNIDRVARNHDGLFGFEQKFFELNGGFGIFVGVADEQNQIRPSLARLKICPSLIRKSARIIAWRKNHICQFVDFEKLSKTVGRENFCLADASFERCFVG